MDKLPLEMLMNILSYAYDMDKGESYVKIINQIGTQSKYYYNNIVKNRRFQEDFYYTLFPAVSLPTTSLHVSDGYQDCDFKIGSNRYWGQLRIDGRNKKVDDHGYLHEHSYWHDNIRKTHYRCKNLDHYNVINKRSKKSRFKDLLPRCRDSYLKVFLEKQKVIKFISIKPGLMYPITKEL